MRARKLTEEEWSDVRRRTYERDVRDAYEQLQPRQPRLSLASWIAAVPLAGCVAAFLDRAAGACRGRLEWDHVPCETAMGAKAPDDERHGQIVCSWHHGTARTGGGWATSKVARALSRERLARLHPGPHVCAGGVFR